MKKNITLLGLLISSLGFSQCEIQGPKIINLMEETSYSIASTVAQCENCHLWSYDGGDIEIIGDRKSSAIKIKSRSIGPQSVFVTVLAPNGIRVCRKNINVIDVPFSINEKPKEKEQPKTIAANTNKTDDLPNTEVVLPPSSVQPKSSVTTTAPDKSIEADNRSLASKTIEKEIETPIVKPIEKEIPSTIINNNENIASKSVSENEVAIVASKEVDNANEKKADTELAEIQNHSIAQTQPQVSEKTPIPNKIDEPKETQQIPDVNAIANNEKQDTTSNINTEGSFFNGQNNVYNAEENLACDVNISDFKETRTNINTIQFSTNLSKNGDFKFKWEALYQNGLKDDSRDVNPQFQYTSQNPINKVILKLESDKCIKEISKNYATNYWSTQSLESVQGNTIVSNEIKKQADPTFVIEKQTENKITETENKNIALNHKEESSNTEANYYDNEYYEPEKVTCDVDVNNFTEVKSGETSVILFPNSVKGYINYSWEAIYQNGLKDNSDQATPEFKYTLQNPILKIVLKLESNRCIKELSKDYKTNFWQFFGYNYAPQQSTK